MATKGRSNLLDDDSDERMSDDFLVRMYRDEAEQEIADRLRNEAEVLDRTDDRQSER